MSTHLGREISTQPANIPDNDIPLVGQYVTLEGLSHKHIPDLWKNWGLDHNDSVFHWLPFPGPTSQDELWQLFEKLQTERVFIIYAIVGDPDGVNLPTKSISATRRHEATGTIGYLEVDTQHRTLETGAVLFGEKLRRSVAATEAHFLLLRSVFEAQGSPPFRRVAWKNNSLNAASRRAAERIGYVYEGTWRNHMISKGQSRDSDWLSITDDEWPLVKSALLKWLERDNFDDAGQQIRTLVEIRAAQRLRSVNDG